jgi:UPF0755 protein
MWKIKTRQKIPRKLIIFTVAIVLLFIVSLVGVRQYYFANLKSASNSQKTVIFKVPRGSTVAQIGSYLYAQHLIRSPWVFEWYVHSTNLSNSLEAGTFSLSPSDSLQQIANTIASGRVAEGIVTILPGNTIRQIQSALINDGFSPANVTYALNPALYANLPIIADKPSGINTLEGLLYPDSFDKTSTTPATVIIKESLIEMGQHITPSMQTAFANEGLSVYQGIILASIVEKEVSNPSDRSQVAQVFLSRLKQGMPLGSDVTANYGAVINNQPLSLSYNSPYNTLLHKGLPPTPIGTVSLSSLNAVAHPASTNWLYFVTGDNGVTYFEQTLQQHNADVAQYCHKLCSQP